MKYCSRCLYPANHPLNIIFDSQGVCSGCRVHEEKYTLDWGWQREKLKRLLHRYRSPSGRIHDCIVPVSGARDSYFIVHTLKHEFGMHPLLVSYNKQYNTDVGIRNLSYLRTLLGCDHMSSTASPEVVKRLTRVTLERMGSIYWHCLAGQTAFPVQIAVRLKIPLIVWGMHQGIDQVGMFSHLDEVEMTRKYRKDHDLLSLEAEDLVAKSDLALRDVAPFIYPHDKEIESVGVRGVFMGNYMPWDSKAFHEKMIDLYGYEVCSQQRTFDTYNDADCFHHSGLHDYIKYLKYGYGRVTDHACREIRLGRLTREQGIDLVGSFQQSEPQDTELFLNWLQVSKEELFSSVNQHRDGRIWEHGHKDGKWRLSDSITAHRNDEGMTAVRLDACGECEFVQRSSRLDGSKGDAYVLIGRGHVDGWDMPDFVQMKNWPHLRPP